MPRIDVYLRSIERFGATGAILASGQSITLRFPTGDRHATQVTPHDQLVMMVREVASPGALDDIDKSRPARFEIDSQGHRYAIAVVPRVGAWQVSIEPAAAASAATSRTSSRTGLSASATELGPEMTIERGQYDQRVPAKSTSGSALLDQIAGVARNARASDVYLAAGSAPVMRVGAQLMPAQGSTMDGDQLSRELGVVAPPAARAAWAEKGSAVFAYGDGVGRIRVSLSRDQRGPGAALRLLPAEAPALDRLGLGGEVEDWLEDRGLVVVAGPSGIGKTTTLAALARAIGERRRRVVALEDPIEIVHASAWISQRAIGDHVTDVAAGVVAAMAEGADAIVIGAVTSAAAAGAVVEAVAGGHLVLTTLVAPVARVAVERMLDRLSAEQRELARALVSDGLLGTIGLFRATTGQLTFEVGGQRGRVS